MSDVAPGSARSLLASERLIYIARAVDRVDEHEYLARGAMLAEKISALGLTPVDPVKMPFPGFEERNLKSKNDRVLSDLAWLRRCDALVADMSIKDHPYVGCVCELVYARMYDVPTIVITGDNELLGDRVWLRYHADFVHQDVDAAVEWLGRLPRGARPTRPLG